MTDMPINQEQIVEYISSKAYKPVRIRELARGLKIPESEYSVFRKLIKDLIKDGTLARIKGGRIGQPEKLSLKSGIFSAIKSGAGFVEPDDGTEEIYVPSEDTGTALDSDIVMVRVKPRGRGKSREGAVVKVLKRNKTVVVGTYQKRRLYETVRPDDFKIGRDIYVRKPNDLRVRDGEKVVVALAEWKDPMINPEGSVVEVLG